MTTEKQTSSRRRSKTIDHIISVSEEAFSDCGFNGVGMKAISQRADVSQALLHYHFGTKERLYEDVIAKRSSQINEERAAMLDRIDFSSDCALAKVLEAMFRPPLGPNGGEDNYARIFSGLIIGRERERALVKKYYDPTARKFVDAFKRVLPTVNPEKAGLCYALALGALISAIGRDGRLENLMGRTDQVDTEERLNNLVTFTQGGIQAICNSSTNHRGAGQ